MPDHLTPATTAIQPPSPITRLGYWLATNMGLPDDCSHADVDDLIDTLSGSSIPTALASLPRPDGSRGYCDECGSETEYGEERAPSTLHLPSCSLYDRTAVSGDVAVTPAGFFRIRARIRQQDKPAS